MSSHYDPIPTDSDPEDEEMAENASLSGNDARTERTRSTDRSHFFRGGTTNSDEDPEEEDPPSTDNRAPLLAASSQTQPAERRTARIRISMSNTQPWTRSRSPTPPPNPQARRPPGFNIWERTLRTLERWRDSHQYTPASQSEQSTSTRQEFLLDTTPIIVDKIVRHEERLDILEDAVTDLPGAEALGELQYQIDNADENISYVNDTVQDLKKQVETLTSQLGEMKSSVRAVERLEKDCHTKIAMAQGITGDRLREFFNSKN